MIELIFEIGHNFHGNIRFAKKMLDAVKECGGTLAKVQLYDVTKLGLRPQESDVYPELEMGQINFEEWRELNAYAMGIGIELFASCFDPERVEWCEKVDVKRYKLASRSIYDTELIKAMEATGKPIIASTGMVKDIHTKFVTPNTPLIKNCKYLFCVAEYPATITNDIFPIIFYEPKGQFPVTACQGFSDHTIGIEWAKEAVRRGATIIEKHFTLDKRLPGCDQAGSADPREMKELVEFIKEYEKQN